MIFVTQNTVQEFPTGVCLNQFYQTPLVAMTVYVLYYYAPHLGETDEPPRVSQWQLSASEQIRCSASRSIGESEQRYYSKCLWSESVSR